VAAHSWAPPGPHGGCRALPAYDATVTSRLRDRQAQLARGGAGVGRQGEADDGPLPFVALDVQLPAVRQHEVLDDRQSEPRAPQLARAGLVHAVEALGDARQVGRRNPDAGVADRELDTLAVEPASPDRHAAPLRGVLHR